jgi:hypothetical protein
VPIAAADARVRHDVADQGRIHPLVQTFGRAT